MKYNMGHEFNTAPKPPLVLAIVTLFLFARAWPRIINPEVWNEDGTHNLFGYINNGFLSILEPVNGFLIFIPKIITFISVQISIVQYPLISTLLAWIVIVTVLAIIATAPLRLKGGVLLAIACLWVPTDPEVYGLPLYTFWWTSLLLYTAIFWNENSKTWGFRVLIIVLAALSAPVILAVLPLFWIRVWAFRRNPAELIVASFASIGAVIQFWIMLQYSSQGTVVSGINLITLPQIIPKFLGSYVLGNLLADFQWIAGITLAGFLAVATLRARSSWVMWALVYLWATAIIMSISRVDIDIIHQELAGPRYFFFPFVLMTWWLLQIALLDRNIWLRGGGWAIMALAAINVLPVIDRNHDSLRWQNHVQSCQYFDSYSIPIHASGHITQAWELPLSGKQCLELLTRDLFFTTDSSTSSASHPYRFIHGQADPAQSDSLDISAVVTNEWLGMDYYSKHSGGNTLPGFQVIGSYNHPNSQSGVLTVIMKRGDRIWYRSEPQAKNQFIEIENHQSEFLSVLPPTSEWVLLEFSNSNLPDEFIVRFEDRGDGWGEWSAVGFKKPWGVNGK